MTTIATAATDTSALRARLHARLDELRAKLASDLIPPPEAAASTLGGEVRDSGDESVAIEHTHVRTALLQRDARELDALHSALSRLDGGSYGVCAECGLDIEPGRLLALPTAVRCSACQEAFEHRAALAPGR
jgi:RNA polymerase-binding transcription factor DksA